MMKIEISNYCDVYYSVFCIFFSGLQPMPVDYLQWTENISLKWEHMMKACRYGAEKTLSCLLK